MINSFRLRTALLVLVTALGLSSCTPLADTSDSGSADGSGSGVSQGLGAQNAAADVQLGIVRAPDVLGIRYEKVSVYNTSSERSDYSINVAIESANGRVQYDTGFAYITNVEPGQRASEKVMFSKPVPGGARVVLKEVQRTASF